MECLYQLSYQVVDTLIWFGIRSIINDFRKKKLKLRRITYLSSSQGSIDDLPTGYLWSPHLVPKPKGMSFYTLFILTKILSFYFCSFYTERLRHEVTIIIYLILADWGPLIDVVGFCFLNQAADFKPPEALVKWLKAGSQPIYVGFGSLVSHLHLPAVHCFL